MDFTYHSNELKNKLNIAPVILAGPEACRVITDNGGTITQNGGFLWNDGQFIVAVKDENHIGTLAHEMRHAWQYMNQVKEYKFGNKNIYDKREKEVNAYKYAIWYLKQYGLSEPINIPKLSR
ncbi:MAG: DUF3920 family protein [Bacillota bacterium]|nr:DUF3920 family protein [Bacillota bacterium]